MSHIRLVENNCLNTLPNDKILDHPNLKDFADDKINVTCEMNFVLGRVENIVEKGENAGYQHFLLFPRFQQASCKGLQKVGIAWLTEFVEVKNCVVC